MPAKPPRPCSTPGCGQLTATARCEHCRSRRARDGARRRESPDERGYGRAWRDGTRLDYLTRHPWCSLCGRVATVPDHWPRSRRNLIAAGVDNPDADERLRPLCDPCHKSETARNQPGGWNRWRGAQ